MTYESSQVTHVLPPYPELVTKLTTIKVNQPKQRSASKYVQSLLQLPVSDARYARDDNGTKCNYYVHDVLHVMGYPVLFQLARDYIKAWRKGEMAMQQMVIQDAVMSANMGCPTVFGLLEPDHKHSHVGVVLPQAPTVIPADLLVSNVGVSIFYGRSMRWAIPSQSLSLVEFFGAP